ncbi:hypothetical protein Tco_0991037 [Tanacetum coccineum]|uniref:Uncharacterized protein n=1 Tax=Tanacetum coccineum TaxID=301880 RepID=A0ABQ5EYW5_9ASTR
MNGDAGYRSLDNTRRTIPVETSDALVVQDNALIGLTQSIKSDSKNCVESNDKTSKQLMEQRQTLISAILEFDASVEMPRVESIRPTGVIFEDWVSDDEDIFQSNDLQATDKPSLIRIEFNNARNESVKPKQPKKPRITTQNPKVDRRD